MNETEPSKKQSKLKSDFVYFATPSLTQWTLCFIACLVWFVVTKPTLLPHISSWYYGGIEGDAGIYVWLVKHFHQRFLHAAWFETNAFYPYGKTLAFSDNFILPGMLYSLLATVFSNEILSYNCTLITLQILGALLLFRVVYGLTDLLFPSITAALTGLTLSPIAGHLGHPQLQCFFIFPLLMLLAIRFLKRQDFSSGLFIGLTICIAFLCSVYYAIFGALFIALLFTGFFSIFPAFCTNKKFLLTLAGSVLSGMLPLLPFAYPYLSVKDLFGKRELYEAFSFSATPLSYLAFTPFNWLLGSLSILSHNEAHLGTGPTMSVLFLFTIIRVFEGDRLYPARIGIIGFLTILVATYTMVPLQILVNLFVTIITWLLVAWTVYSLILLGKVEREYKSAILTQRDIQAILVWCAVGFLAVSFGPIADTTQKELSFSPFTVLYTLVPGFEGVRAIGRAGIVYGICLTILFPLSISILRRKQLASAFFCNMLLCLPLLENYCSKFPYDAPLSRPPVLAKLAEAAANTGGHAAALMLPYAPAIDSRGEIQSWSLFAKANVYAMNWFSDLPVSILNGYSGQKTKMMRELPRRLSGFPDPGSLREIGSYPELRYIVVVPKLFVSFDKQTFEAMLARYPKDLRLIEKDSEGNYLIEHIGSTKIDPAFVIKLPGRYSSTRLRLESAECKSGSAILAYEADSLRPFLSLSVPSQAAAFDGVLDLSKLHPSIGIRRVRLQPPDGCLLNLLK